MDSRNYYKWLLKEIKIEYDDCPYDKLFWHLYQRIFTWSVPNDDNRAADGIDLRGIFLRDGGALQERDYKAPCSVLEMLIALSIRCEFDIMGDGEEDKSDKLFWIMIENLGLDVYEDYFFDEDYVDDILDIWLLRRFGKDGSGSIFPIKKNCSDQRKVEIWFQMCGYLNENFYDNW